MMQTETARELEQGNIAGQRASARRRRDRWRRLARQPSAMVGLVILVFWIFAAIFWPLIVPYGPTDLHLLVKFSGPTWDHWLGSDNLGRDVLSRMLAGSRTVLLVSTSATVLGVLVGTALGLIAAFYGG